MVCRQWAGRSLLLLFAAFGLADGAHHMGGCTIEKRLISSNNRPLSLQTPSLALIRSLRAGAEPSVSPDACTSLVVPRTSSDSSKLGKGIAVFGVCVAFVPFFIQPSVERFWKEFNGIWPNVGNGRLETAAALALASVALFWFCLFTILVFF